MAPLGWPWIGSIAVAADIPKPVPAIRAKSVRTSQKQLAYQAVGLVNALAATEAIKGPTPFIESMSREELIAVFEEAISLTGKTDSELTEEVNLKKAKYHRDKRKYKKAMEKRFELGLPTEGIIP